MSSVCRAMITFYQKALERICVLLHVCISRISIKVITKSTLWRGGKMKEDNKIEDERINYHSF